MARASLVIAAFVALLAITNALNCNIGTSKTSTWSSLCLGTTCMTTTLVDSSEVYACGSTTECALANTVCCTTDNCNTVHAGAGGAAGITLPAVGVIALFSLIAAVFNF
uniref:Uncharacterized protein n=1 Tax=Palpitomonas bilix TaxID=652834 RepID=A0A7S3DL51_9EUKA|mmetsp:Transcript_42388/g.109067  ORF Transcript_42388/g.109067 Transcript_42388/m.109067 type:complete len:109 (+) Transcript_42388:104-430(+)